MLKDIVKWTRCCIPCQRCKKSEAYLSPLQPLIQLLRDFRPSISIYWTISPSDGFTFLLTCIDRYTRWPGLKQKLEIQRIRILLPPLFRIVWLSLHHSLKQAIRCQNQNGQSRYQWSCWVSSEKGDLNAFLKWYLEKPLCFQILLTFKSDPKDPPEFLLGEKNSGSSPLPFSSTSVCAPALKTPLMSLLG
ncbi:hypothetical protein TNIN_131911 [Trichonephila inaurata madagascariensis]|uniref:Integrase zinc-binding domain-containing protein n=1 Tax=Trichonephila inaurata madagascariensis TaxID=2747483 RepID=A0A8X6XVS5_9ARAC|nr:hypothetical protein TNIN_131911 [Trichonephila inaurata madagascariensis]